MILVLSGEGKTDLGILEHGTGDFKAGAMYMIVDKLIEKRYRYSLYETLKKNIIYIPETELLKKVKSLKTLKFPSKKGKKETAYYYKNARALAILSKNHEDSIAIFFRDSDGTNSSSRSEWKDKYESIMNGFEIENYYKGVAMLPKPKSEAWLLCAIKNEYISCNKLENESGNDKSPNSLKNQLAVYNLSHDDLCEKIKSNMIDVGQINMESFNIFRDRLIEVTGE